MSGKKREHKRHGHSCWSCDLYLSNEKFSGRGHARHLCRACAKLGRDEFAYRQARRNLERCMTWEGIIPHKRRKSFERFLQHENPRAHAEAMLEQDRLARASMWETHALDDADSLPVADWIEERTAGLEAMIGETIQRFEPSQEA